MTVANGDLYGLGAGGSAGVSGTVNLPEPAREDWHRAIVPKGSRIDTADGGVVWDQIAYKYKWDLTWKYLTTANKNAIENAIKSMTSTLTFQDWEGYNAVVQPLLSTLTVTPVMTSDGTTRRHTVSITFEGV